MGYKQYSQDRISRNRTNYTHCRHMITTDYTTNIVAEYSIAKRALLLSADVELNTGPVALGDVLEAVKSS